MTPRRSLLNREDIFKVALSLLDESDINAVSMRNIAQRLNVQAMSLYNHIENKEDLLNGIVELVLNEVQIPLPSGDWKADLRNAASSFYNVLLQHPNVLPIISTHSPITEKGINQVEKILFIFKKIDITGVEAFSLLHIIVAYIIGYAGMSLMNEQGTGRINDDGYTQEDLRKFTEILGGSFDLDKRNLKEEFMYGFNLFLDGVEKNLQKGR